MNFVLFLLLLPLIKPMRTGTNVVCGVHYMTQFKFTGSKDEKKQKTGRFTATISLWKRAAKTASTTGKSVLVLWMRQIRAREISFTIWSKWWYQTFKKSCSDCTHAACLRRRCSPMRNCWVSNSLHGWSFSSLLGLSTYGASGLSQYIRPWQRRLAYNPSAIIHSSTPLSSAWGSAPGLSDAGSGDGKRMTSAPLWNLSSEQGEEEEEDDEVIRHPSRLLVVTSLTRDSL